MRSGCFENVAVILFFQGKFLPAMKNRFLHYAYHIFGWVLFLSLIVTFVFRKADRSIDISGIFSIQFLVFCMVYIFLFYANTFLFIPKLYLHKKYLYYFANKLSHKVAIKYFTDSLTLVETIGDHLLLVAGDKKEQSDNNSSQHIEDTFLLKLIPGLSIFSYPQIGS